MLELVASRQNSKLFCTRGPLRRHKLASDLDTNSPKPHFLHASRSTHYRKRPLILSCGMAVTPSSMHKPWAGSESYQISGLNTIHGWTASPVHSSSLPFCVRFNAAVTRRAATLDTGPVANGYPRGVPTRLSTNHFQSARPSAGSSLRVVSRLDAFRREICFPGRLYYHRRFVVVEHDKFLASI